MRTAPTYQELVDKMVKEEVWRREKTTPEETVAKTLGNEMITAFCLSAFRVAQVKALWADYEEKQDPQPS